MGYFTQEFYRMDEQSCKLALAGVDLDEYDCHITYTIVIGFNIYDEGCMFGMAHTPKSAEVSTIDAVDLLSVKVCMPQDRWKSGDFDYQDDRLDITRLLSNKDIEALKDRIESLAKNVDWAIDWDLVMV